MRLEVADPTGNVKYQFNAALTMWSAPKLVCVCGGCVSVCVCVGGGGGRGGLG